MRRSAQVAAGLICVCATFPLYAEETWQETLKSIADTSEIIAIVDTNAVDVAAMIERVKSGRQTFLYVTNDADRMRAMQSAASSARLLGSRLVVDLGTLQTIRLMDNVADRIIVTSEAAKLVPDEELLRALRPRGTAHLGERQLVKPVPDGIDEWSHPYHGPDNNPQSRDQHVRGEFRTQFLAAPLFSPMPEQSVIAGGRIFKAMGHIAHKANQNEWLNTLVCINAYNGEILWKRPLSPGFMIHRNTMIATEDALLMGDHESCKIIDAATGEIRRQITIPENLTDGPVWKWMALREGTLYALVGNPEIQVDTQRSQRLGLGHWPWGMWKGHDYKDPRTAFGYGRTLVAIDVKTGKLRWHFRDPEFLDARGVCMNEDRIFCCSPQKFLLCIDVATGKELWRNTDKDLLEALGPQGKAQHYITGYATTCYMKCNAEHLFFAGPQRSRLVVASAADGKLQWTHSDGNLQLVLRDDAIYAAGPKTTGVRLEYATGKKLGTLPTRRACTRATGCVDSIFYRTSGGTVRIVTDRNVAQHIAPMRPPCQDGVLVSNGHLYWGPWMCGCQLSLYGNICLSPVGTTQAREQVTPQRWHSGIADVQPLAVRPHDWPRYRGNEARSDITSGKIPAAITQRWVADVCLEDLPTAPVTAGGMVFVADRTGTVQALDQQGELVWKAFTAGPIYYPPAIAHDRVYVGSADGHVYAFAARTGDLLWSYRVAPEDRRIPVYGKLISAWPVSGGIVIHDSKVYAAAGITHYDGTIVVALDAISGELMLSNDSSGVLSAEVNNGISLQGNLMIAAGELRFLAGGVYETARFDLQTLKCLNKPKVQVTSQFRTAFYPYYPDYGKYVSLEHTCSNGSTLCHDASYEGSVFGDLALQLPLPDGAPRTPKEASRWRRLGKNDKTPKNVWQDKQKRRFTGFVVSEQQLLATGHNAANPQDTFLSAINIADGANAWTQKLPALPVKGGAAIDQDGLIYVSLEDGRLMCFAPRD